jgi:hypothetical protein
MDLSLDVLDAIETTTASDFVNGFVAGVGGVAVVAAGVILLT